MLRLERERERERETERDREKEREREREREREGHRSHNDHVPSSDMSELHAQMSTLYQFGDCGMSLAL